MNKNLLIVVIFISLIALIIFVLTHRVWKGNLVNPMGSNVTSTPTPTSAPPVAPKEFKFDRNTDLKVELEKVNPEVLDSDFE